MNYKYKEMKKLNLLLYAFIFVSILIKSQNNNSITVFTEGGEPFYLIINGLKQNTKAETNVKAIGINGQQVKAKVIFDQQGIPDCDKSIPMMWAAEAVSNTEFVFSIKKNRKGQYKWEYVSHSPIQVSNVNPIQNNNIGQNNNNTTNGNQSSLTSVTSSTTTTNNNGGVGINIGINGIGMNMSISDGNNGNITNTTTTTTTTSYTTTSTGVTQGNSVANSQINANNIGTNSTNVSNNSNQNNLSSNNSACNSSMPTAEFNEAKKSIQSKSFDDTKLNIAKQIADNNCMSVDQIKGIISLFSFENNKLEFAKYAYDRCSEKRNYYKVGDTFTFNSNVEELNEFIKSKK
jgi:hypothetical protein